LNPFITWKSNELSNHMIADLYEPGDANLTVIDQCVELNYDVSVASWTSTLVVSIAITS